MKSAVCTYLFFILSITALADDIKDIKKPVNFPNNISFLIVLGVILALAGLILLVILLKSKLKKDAVGQKIVPKPAHKIAFEALEGLLGKNLPSLGKIKEYYSELSDIIRHYLENRFDIKAPEMTTEEFLVSLSNTEDLNGLQKELLRKFLSHCDLVKFAKYGPTKQEIENAFNSAKKLVDETKEICK